MNLDKSLFFSRKTVFFKDKDDKISIIDVEAVEGRTTALEPWLGVVVLYADGQHTIRQLIDHLAAQYQGSPPPDLERTIESVIGRLVESAVIELTEKPVELAYHFSLPSSELDPERAKVSMKVHGYLQEI